MISALINQGSQFFEGTLYKKRNDTQGDKFRYEEVNQKRKEFGTAINNLIAEQGRFTIKTNWDLKFEPRQYLVDKDGKMWQITEIVRFNEEVASQVNFWLKKNIDTSYVMSLVEVENPWELK